MCMLNKYNYVIMRSKICCIFHTDLNPDSLGINNELCDNKYYTWHGKLCRFEIQFLQYLENVLLRVTFKKKIRKCKKNYMHIHLSF